MEMMDIAKTPIDFDYPHNAGGASLIFVAPGLPCITRQHCDTHLQHTTPSPSIPISGIALQLGQYVHAVSEYREVEEYGVAEEKRVRGSRNWYTAWKGRYSRDC